MSSSLSESFGESSDHFDILAPVTTPELIAIAHTDNTNLDTISPERHKVHCKATPSVDKTSQDWQDSMRST
jgi:hypothetical protein